MVAFSTVILKIYQTLLFCANATLHGAGNSFDLQADWFVPHLDREWEICLCRLAWPWNGPQLRIGRRWWTCPRQRPNAPCVKGWCRIGSLAQESGRDDLPVIGKQGPKYFPTPLFFRFGHSGYFFIKKFRIAAAPNHEVTDCDLKFPLNPGQARLSLKWWITYVWPFLCFRL